MLELTASCFDMAQHKIYMLMAKDCYPRFLRSPAYTDLVCQAKPGPKAPLQEKKAWNVPAIPMEHWQRSPSGFERCGRCRVTWLCAVADPQIRRNLGSGDAARRPSLKERLKTRVETVFALSVQVELRLDGSGEKVKRVEVTITPECREDGTFLCHAGKLLWSWCVLYLCESLTLFSEETHRVLNDFSIYFLFDCHIFIVFLQNWQKRHVQFNL